MKWQKLSVVNRGLKERTKKFVIRSILLVQYINQHGPVAAKIIANKQMLRSGIAIAANYRVAWRCKSRRDFISKIGTVVEEADETQLWLELIIESKLMKESLLKDLLQGCTELVAIMTASKTSAVKGLNKS